MIEWATKEKVNSDFFKTTMKELRERYIHVVGDDNLTIYKEFELPFIVEKIKQGNYKTILDFGTGTSCLPAYLETQEYEVWALDDGSWHPEVNHRSYNEVYASNVKYVVDDLLKNPQCIPDNYFDVIYSASTIEHIKNPEKYIRALKKKIKKGGLHIHIIDHDLVSHPLNFEKIIKAMGLKDDLGEMPDDFYNPIANIGRIAIWALQK